MYQLDWRWVERYRDLDAFDAYWWWAQAGPFNEEEQRQWEKLYQPAPDEATKEALGSLIAQSCRRELVAALSEQREPHLWYPALAIEEVRRRISGMLQLEAEISKREPHTLVRRLYQGAIEEEACFLRLIEATYDGDSERFVQLDQRLNPAPTPEEMEEALSSLKRVLLQGLLSLETAEVSQRVMQFMREQLHLSLDLSWGKEEAEALRQQGPVFFSRQGPIVSAQAAKRFFEAVLHENGYDGWQVNIDPKASGPRVEAGLRQVFLQEKPVSVERIREYLAHELAGHVERAGAGEHSLLGLLAIGTKGHLLTEEGLALYRERQAAASFGQPFDDSGIWFGVLATGFASGVCTPPQTFLSLYAFFEPLHLLFRLLKHLDNDLHTAQERARNAALARCLRTYRGVPDLQRQGVCFSKDVVYLRGLRQIECAVMQDETVPGRLAVGKIALDDLSAMRELGIVQSPQPLLELAYQPGLDAYILSFEQSEKSGDKHA